jgi:galactose mutarotase-like enzyme
VPVAFGWHPYFKVGGARSRWKLRLPERTAIGLDSRGIPSGGVEPAAAENEPLGKRAFDDLFKLGDDRRFSLEGGGRRIDLAFDESYPYLQVFAPPGESFVAIEPMAAATDALVQGGAPTVKPGQEFAASFTVSAR